jgi:4-hydroxy-tetrahydrodipicolinate reductase
MRIAIIGYGKMGKAIFQKAVENDVTVSAVIDPVARGAGFKSITPESVKDADVCIDFSHPEAVITNISILAAMKKNIVLGTTGWEQHICDLKKLVLDSESGLVYAGNYSIGMNLFYRIVEYSSRIINKFSQYDTSGMEIHHNKKADSPSGTAKALTGILLKNLEQKKRAKFGISSGVIDTDELHFASLRCGNYPGEHKVIFDSLPDTIELTHRVRNRDGFVDGALLAAEWISGKTGFYSFDELIHSKINEEI